MTNWLFKYTDNSSLIVFRIIFGLLCFLESVGAIFTGWIKRTLIDPDFTFNFIGFEFLQPLPGNGMYIYYCIMGVFGLLIMIGYRYRFSAIMFTLMWAGVYFMQKSSYNNHYYLLLLLSGLMALLPANRYLSVDAKRNPSITEIAMPNWCRWLFVVQMFIVYTYASIAKIYPDWLDTSVMAMLMKSKAHYYIIGNLLQESWIHYFLAYGGILFDGLIIPLLLFKPTRKWAFFISIFFHMFNSIVFQVGIFPYLSLAFAVFFFEPKTIHRIFLKHRKPFYEDDNTIKIPSYNKALIGFFIIFFSIQIVLPLRQHWIEDNVLWTEEGHRLSWRMMLRSKYGYATYKIVNHTQNKTKYVSLNNYLSKKQQRHVSTKPDFMWQFAQRLKQDYKAKGDSISVYITSKVSVNGKPQQDFTDPNVDIANEPWLPFSHSPWILPYKPE